MKKFKEGDLIYSVIKTYPKVEFFMNDGVQNSMYYNRLNYLTSSSRVPHGHIGLNDFPHIEFNGIIVENTFYILTEGGDIINAENGDRLIIE